MDNSTMALAMAAAARDLGHEGDPERDAKAEVAQERKPKAKKAKAKRKARAKKAKPTLAEREAKLRAKYPHVREGSIAKGRGTTKLAVVAEMPCGHPRKLFTSDVFQVRDCGAKACRKAARATKSA